MKKWRCTVCNYIHTGQSPPEKCPVCGADKSKFVEISEQEAKQYEAKKNQEGSPAGVGNNSGSKAPDPANASGQTGAFYSREASGVRNFIEKQLVIHHVHPVSVHVPNGVLPIVVLFMFVAALFGFESLAKSAFYFTFMVVISMPLVMYTGYNEWQRKYNGAKTTMFVIKLAAASAVALTSFLVLLWYFINPDVIFSGAARRGSFLLLNLVMFGATGIAGFIGGKLVFKD